MKKKIIAFVGAALFTAGLYVNQAHGASVQQQYNEAVIKSCSSAKDLAYDVMVVRQTQITEAEQIKMINDVDVSQGAKASGIRIVKAAHTKPLVPSEAVGIVASSFSYEIQEKCLSDMTGKIL